MKSRIKKALCYVEIGGIVVAFVFGVRWVRDPNGPSEPITFLALLLGSTLGEFVRRRLALEDEGHVRAPTKTDASSDGRPGAVDKCEQIPGETKPADGHGGGAETAPTPRGPLRVHFIDGSVCKVELSATIRVRPRDAPQLIASFGTYSNAVNYALQVVEACALAELEKCTANDARQSRASISATIGSAATPKLACAGFTMEGIEIRSIDRE